MTALMTRSNNTLFSGNKRSPAPIMATPNSVFANRVANDAFGV